MAKKWIKRKDGVRQRYNVGKRACGNCYEAAGRMIVYQRIPESLLVHGEVFHPKTGWHGHAWIEIGDVVLDYSNGMKVVMRKEEYYKRGKVRNIIRYSPTAAANLMLEYQHFGPWGDSK